MKKIFLTTLLGLAAIVANAQDFIAGFDFTGQTGAADVADFAADVAGSQAGVSIDTTAFTQGSGFSGAALSLEARQVGFDTVGNSPALADFDGQNGFSSAAYGLFFQAAINDLSFTIDIDTSGFDSINFGYDSFSDDTAVHSGGEWFTSFDGGTDISLGTVNFASAYAANSYDNINVVDVDSLSLTFTFDSTEADTFGAGVTGQRVHFDNFAIGGTPVPEPSTYAAIAGMLALATAAYRRRRRA
jgi:hypothetical protein